MVPGRTCRRGRAVLIVGEHYDVFACRFASLPARQAERVFYQFDVYGDKSALYDLSLYFWLVRDEERTVLVDCGWNQDRAVERGYPVGADPMELLRRFGVEPTDVDHVVISHMHFDHAGNLEVFPNATFTIARSEYEFWTGPYSDRTVVARFIDKGDINAVRRLNVDGRLNVVDDTKFVAPGIEVICVGGHTPGQLITVVESRSGRIVLAADAVHLHEEMELDRPYVDFYDIGEVYAAYDVLRQFASEEGTTIVAGHDPREMTRFRAVDPDWIDLTAPIADGS
jgi:glyoxylase-like metal-dependent hydrolase (beta-lactamase superfamily II)